MSATVVSPERSVPRAGWMVVAAKEFSDHLLSARFLVLVAVLGLAAAIPLYFAAAEIGKAAQAASDVPAIFLYLFWFSPQVGDGFTLPSVTGFIAYVAPLLGLAFSFGAVNGERAEGTLPRLLSQPIHRDDVINGKFAAGLAVIGLVLVAVIGVITAFGLIRLGVVPTAAELLRLLIWLVITFVYVSLWLAVGMLLSVVVRRAATSALIGFGLWLLVTFFGGLIVSLVGGVLAPATGSGEAILRDLGTRESLLRLLPDTLYREASIVLLNPTVAVLSTPSTIGQATQAQQQIASLQSLDQSFILVWPQVVALVAITVGCFALAYVQFMRQEVRA